MTGTPAPMHNSRFDRAALARLAEAGYCVHDTAMPAGPPGQVRCGSGCAVVFTSSEVWARADPLPFRPPKAWVDAHPAVAAARAAEAAYLRRHPEYAELWWSWAEAADSVVDPERVNAADWERVAAEAYRALPDWFTGTMASLLGNTAGAVVAAETGWLAHQPPAIAE